MNNTRVLTLGMCEVENGKQQNPESPPLQGEQTAGHFSSESLRVRVARKSVTLFSLRARSERCGASRALSLWESEYD